MKKKFFLGAMTLLVSVALVGTGQDTSSQSDTAGLPNYVFSGSVSLKKADFLHNDSLLTLYTQNVWVDMPYMTRTFKISGIGKDEVIIMFQAQWQQCYGEAVIRLLIDGVQEHYSIMVQGADSPADTSTNGYMWVTRPLQAGVIHTATIQWMNSSPNGIVMQVPSMVIFHR